MNAAFKIGQPRFLSADDVVTLHRASVDDYGGVDGLTEMGRLESAIATATHDVGGQFAHGFPFGMATGASETELTPVVLGLSELAATTKRQRGPQTKPRTT